MGVSQGRESWGFRTLAGHLGGGSRGEGQSAVSEARWGEHRQGPDHPPFCSAVCSR